MNLDFFKELFGSQAVTALCWTLFHSLWEGLIFAIIAGIMIMLTRRSTPVFRYNALSALFATLVIAIIVTFFYEQQKVESMRLEQSSASHPVSITAGYSQTLILQNSNEGGSFTQLLSNFFAQYAYLIVAVWFFILCAKSVKMMFALLFTRHLRKYKSHVPAFEWRKELGLLCHQLNISRTVTLLESEIIKLPVVFGHLKPIIFFPLGLLTHLAPEQVEAILIHELAHIRRNDYVANLVQNVVEILFFFNPAILWISSLIREERENCCDDMAIAITRNKKRYVEALVGFKQLSLYSPFRNVVAFAGNKGSFMNRVHRIVQNKNHTLSSIEKGSLVSCCIVAILLVLAFAQPIKSPVTMTIATSVKAAKPVAGAPVAAVLKTAPPPPLPGKPFRREPTDSRLVKLTPDLPLMVDHVIDDLVSENVVKDRTGLISFHLTNQFLKVNGQLQPAAIQQKLREKYLADPPVYVDLWMIGDPNFGLCYDRENGIMNIGISNDRSVHTPTGSTDSVLIVNRH
jgi:bla regulator protein BlaR1